MGNCLKTQLKGVVDNPNLPFFGKGIIEVNAASSTTIKLRIDGGTSYLDVVGEGTITNEGTTGTHVLCYSDTNVTLSAGQYKVLFDKYKAIVSMAETNNVRIDTDDFEYVTSDVTEVFYARSLRGDIKYFNSLPLLTRLYATNCNELTGDIKDLLLTNLVYFTVAQTNVGGDISNLARNLSLEEISIANSKLYGSIEGLVTAFRNNSKVSGSLTMGNLGYGNNNISWKGVKIVAQDNCSLSWTASTITFNGETINA